MLGSGYDIRVVAEANTSEELVYWVGEKSTVASALCCVEDISWVDVQSHVQVLADVLDKDTLGYRTWFVL